MPNDSNVIRMANDIAKFWQSYPLEEARENFAEHINKYWDPPMRKRLHELSVADPRLFLDLVLRAVDLVRCSFHNPIKAEFKDKVGGG